MTRQSTAALITLGSSGAVTYQRLANDDVFALVRDNEPEATQLLAEGRFDGSMFASADHPLLNNHDPFADDSDWLLTSHAHRRLRNGRKKAKRKTRG